MTIHKGFIPEVACCSQGESSDGEEDTHYNPHQLHVRQPRDQALFSCKKPDIRVKTLFLHAVCMGDLGCYAVHKYPA